MSGEAFDEVNRLVGRIYDVAVDPERFEQLVDAWTERLGRGDDAGQPGILSRTELAGHIERAEHVLRELASAGANERDSAGAWALGIKAAAFVVDRNGTILAANDGARASLSVRKGASLTTLPIDRNDIAVLGDLVAAIEQGDGDDPRVVRLRLSGADTPVLVRLAGSVGGNRNQIGIVTSILHWSASLSEELRGGFELTDAELSVLRDLTSGYSVREICERSGRSEPTLRSHIQALLGKTGTRSQLELVRMTLTLLDASYATAGSTQLSGPAGIEPGDNEYLTVTLRDGRRLDYLSLGDPAGRPFILLPTDLGFTRFPAPAERWLAANRMRMIVPIRAGYGYSSPLPKRANAYDIAVSDMIELLDQLQIGRVPVLAMCDDFRLGVEFAGKRPDRVTAIVGMAPAPPARTAEHYRRMSKWSRLFIMTARRAPWSLSFVAIATLQYGRRVGPKRYMQSFLAGSPVDLALLDDEEILAAILRGSEIAIGQRASVHAAPAGAAGLIASHGDDWSDLLSACPVPIVLFCGHKDPLSPFATIKEYAEANPNIRLRDDPRYGFLLYPLWPEIFAEVEARLPD